MEVPVTVSLLTSAASALPRPKTALVVDSGPDLNRMLACVLKGGGWSIQRAVDNKTVLSLARANPYDLIITGEKTCGPEDIELLRKIRSVRPHLRLIIITDKWTRGDVVTAMREQAFSYFCRPFLPSDLADMVRQAMAEPAWDDGIEIISATPEWVRLMAKCDLATARRLEQFGRGIGDIPEAERDEIVSAFREILLNAMEHGANFDSRQYVEISYIRSTRAVACMVKDPGQGFSLDELHHAAVSNSPQDLLRHFAVREERGLRPGGFGLLMAKKLVDDLIHSEKGNEVLLIKYLHPQGQPEQSQVPH
jgi:DNA-binding response OmpR family regulator